TEGQQSGNFDNRDDNEDDPTIWSVRKRAEYLAMQEVGHVDDWRQFVEQAEGEKNQENYESWLVKRGWVFDTSYNYVNPEHHLLYEARRFTFKLLPSKKKFILRHREGDKWVNDAGPVRVPYNLLAMLAQPNEDIALQEGEKGVEASRRMGLLSSCIQGQ